MSEIDIQLIKKLEKEIIDLKEQNSSQLSMYEMTTMYLKKLQEELKLSEQKLIQSNKNLTDSINYAKHIQDAFTVNLGTLQKILPNSFIFEQPRDIVSGDFLWVYENGNEQLIALGDCTGHGVPGAMLSIFVISMLNQIVSLHEKIAPKSILQNLDFLMNKYLKQYNEKIKDSVEISILKFNKEKTKICFSAAKRPFVIVRNNNLTLYEGSKFILGDSLLSEKSIKEDIIEIQKNDMLYMFSDGFADQFGGENDKKFSSKKLLSLLQDIANYEPIKQHEIISSTFNFWKKDTKQIDDVLLIGIKI